MYVGSFHPPPRMKRRPSFTALRVHSLALPAMSWVPYGPMPPSVATGTVPAFRKLLTGTVLCVKYVPAAWLHHSYALARQEFKAALLEVVAFHYPGRPAEVEQEAANLLSALS